MRIFTRLMEFFFFSLLFSSLFLSVRGFSFFILSSFVTENEIIIFILLRCFFVGKDNELWGKILNKTVYFSFASSSYIFLLNGWRMSLTFSV